jgi:hypothetical protein
MFDHLHTGVIIDPQDTQNVASLTALARTTYCPSSLPSPNVIGGLFLVMALC